MDGNTARDSERLLATPAACIAVAKTAETLQIQGRAGPRAPATPVPGRKLDRHFAVHGRLTRLGLAGCGLAYRLRKRVNPSSGTIGR